MDWKYLSGPIEPLKMLCGQNNIRDDRFEEFIKGPTGVIAPLSTDFLLADIAVTVAQRAGYSNLFLQTAINGINNQLVLFPFDQNKHNPFQTVDRLTVLVDGNPAGMTRPLLLSRVGAMYPRLEIVD